MNEAAEVKTCGACVLYCKPDCPAGRPPNPDNKSCLPMAITMRVINLIAREEAEKKFLKLFSEVWSDFRE